MNVAIGTDGAASNNSLNFFKELYLTSNLQKIKHKDPIALEAIEVLKMATINGAKALSLNNTEQYKLKILQI